MTFYNPRYGLLNQLLSALGFDGSRDWLFDVDTALPAVAATWVFTAGVVMILVMAEIEAIPAEIYESARVDGASRWQLTRHITLPLLRNVVGVCLILVLLFTLAYFDGVYIMTGGGPADRTLTLSLYAFQEYSNSDWGYANAIGVVLIAARSARRSSLLRRVFRLGERDSLMAAPRARSPSADGGFLALVGARLPRSRSAGSWCRRSRRQAQIFSRGDLLPNPFTLDGYRRVVQRRSSRRVPGQHAALRRRRDGRSPR